MFFGQGFPGFSGFSSFGGPSDDETSTANTEIENKELYDILEVSQTASASEIKASYRAKIIKAHPDKGGDPELFKKIQAAYEVLSNPEKRELYDKYGIDALRGDSSPGMDPFDSIFRNLFGHKKGGGHHGHKKFKPMVKEIHVTLEDLYNGGIKHLTYARQRTCADCEGKGGKDAKTCTKCRGHGMVEKIVQLAPGFISSSQGVCPSCQGEGQVFDQANKCKSCKGEKIKTEEKTIEIPIEAGAKSDHQITFSGEGHEIPGALAGDLIVQFKTEVHSSFERKGADLYYKKKISLYEALTGASFYIKQLDGKKLLLKTSPNDVISPGVRKELKGKGMPFYGDAMSHGNLYVDFDVEFPKRSELKNIDQLKNILPVPKDNTLAGVDKNRAQILNDFDAAGTHARADGGRTRMEEEEDDEDMPRGQRVQCAQQ